MKKKQGRPFNPDGVSLTESIHLRVHPDEKRQFEQIAAKKNMKISAWIRSILLDNSNEESSIQDDREQGNRTPTAAATAGPKDVKPL